MPDIVPVAGDGQKKMVFGLEHFTRLGGRHSRREDDLGRTVREMRTKQNKTLEYKQEGASNWEN